MKATANACGLALRSVLIETSLTPSMTKKLLVMAALSGDVCLVQGFLDRGVSVSRGWEPSIVAAARNGHVFVVEQLMRYRKQENPHRSASIVSQCVKPWGVMTAPQIASLLSRC